LESTVIDAALQQLRAEGFPVFQEDVERPSSSVYERIKLVAAMPFLFRKGSSMAVCPAP
jgi:hypothetical protein